MSMQEDFDAFLETDDFAVMVRSENPDRTFAAIFDNEFMLAKLGGIELETTAPQLETKVENVAGFERGVTTIIVPGIETPFMVDRVQPDGTGWVRVELAP